MGSSAYSFSSSECMNEFNRLVNKNFNCLLAHDDTCVYLPAKIEYAFLRQWRIVLQTHICYGFKHLPDVAVPCKYVSWNTKHANKTGNYSTLEQKESVFPMFLPVLVIYLQFLHLCWKTVSNHSTDKKFLLTLTTNSWSERHLISTESFKVLTSTDMSKWQDLNQ